MKAKDKKKHIKITLKNIITFLVFIISLLYSVIFYNYYFARGNVYASEVIAEVEKTKISQAPEINLEKIIQQNAEEGQKEEYTVEETTLEYITKYKNNPNLPKGNIQVIQEGREGKQEITTKKIYQNKELIKEEQVSCKVTKAAINKIVEVGTSN